jgi:hypothetical protein
MYLQAVGQQSRWRAPFAYCILMACVVFYVVRGYHDERTLLHSLDFRTVYGASRCLLQGGNPYDSDQAFRAYVDGGGPSTTKLPAFQPHEVVYLPPALAVIAPLGALRVNSAIRVWLALSTGIYVLSVLLISSLCVRIAPLTSAIGIGLMLLGSTKPVMLGQPEQLSSGLCAIAVWCFLTKRGRWIGASCFAISLAFKPHVVGLVWLFFLICREYRVLALRALVATVILCLPTCAWLSFRPASVHWLHDVSANVAALSQHGMTNDPGPANPSAPNLVGLKNLLSLFRDDPRFYTPITYIFCGLLLSAWLLALRRFPPSAERDYLGLAVIALISMLPVYHRDYDVGLLIVMFPGLAVLAGHYGRIGKAASALTLAAWIPLAHDFQVVAEKRIIPHLSGVGPWETLFWLRSVSWAALLLAIVYLGCFWHISRQQAADGEIPAST